MKGISIKFKNRPNENGTLSNFTIDNCLIAQSGSTTIPRPQVIVHLPKTSDKKVKGAWFEYDGGTYHVIGEAAKSIAENTPTPWNRYVVAEKMY